MGSKIIKENLNTLYEERIILFLDILDFRGIIERGLENERKSIKELNKMLDEITEIFNLENRYWETSKTKEITQFSDSLIISYKVKEIDEVMSALSDIQYLIAKMITYEVLVRGAVVKGKMYHTKKRAFGPGFIKAYITETNAAIYPRVVIEEEIIKEYGKFCMKNDISKKEYYFKDTLYQKDHDGFYFVDYFYGIGFLMSQTDNFNDSFYNYPEYLKCIRKIILENINNPKPDIKLKYKWMKEKYNQAINILKEPRIRKSIKESVDEDELEEFLELTNIE